MYVREGDVRRCVLSLAAPHALQWIVPEGALMPLDRGSAGRALSMAPGTAVESTSNRPPWFESVEEREKGVASVSAPVRRPDGAVVAAVSVSGPVERLTRSPGARFGPAVAEAAARLAAGLPG